MIREFFGEDLAQKLVKQGRTADLIIGNNVYAHVPDIKDFTIGVEMLLKTDGVITLEFPHLMRLMEFGQFDTVYHEHFSYLSLKVVRNMFLDAGLKIFDVEELSTHGGSLRVYGCRKDDDRVEMPNVQKVLHAEIEAGLSKLTTYAKFQGAAEKIKNSFLQFLLNEKEKGRTVAAYGAAAKGNTLLNFAGVKSDLLSFICDSAPSKQGKFTPGGHIPILPPAVLRERKPETVVILPWNISEEIMTSHGYIREWGGKFVTVIPELSIKS